MNDYLTKNPAEYKSVRRVVGAHASIMHEWDKGAWHKLDKWAPKAYSRLQANWATYKDLLGRLDSPDFHAAMCIYVHYLSYGKPKDVSKSEPIESGVLPTCWESGRFGGPKDVWEESKQLLLAQEKPLDMFGDALSPADMKRWQASSWDDIVTSKLWQRIFHVGQKPAPATYTAKDGSERISQTHRRMWFLCDKPEESAKAQQRTIPQPTTKPKSKAQIMRQLAGR